SDSWEPGILTLIDQSIVSDQLVTSTEFPDQDKTALGVPSGWSGTDNTEAGAILGSATVTGALKSGAIPAGLVLSKTLPVRGFDPYSIPWDDFYNFVVARVGDEFPFQNGIFTDSLSYQITQDQL